MRQSGMYSVQLKLQAVRTQKALAIVVEGLVEESVERSSAERESNGSGETKH